MYDKNNTNLESACYSTSRVVNHYSSRRQFLFIFFFSKKTSLDISYELSADHSHAMSKLLLSGKIKNKYKILDCHLLQILLGVLRVKDEYLMRRFY